ncbi:MAG: hypothetical protein F4100_03675 [Rhodothermaceae bacterium]|nr:hypothetical protein [Bacteroidota bacterium]MXW31621.1 hypothetical protein [Rhodothermaceae bacterium]MYE63396.1 hypothetical protein [Rhodothermaceae bacterium]MYJ19837.1 hypothetical protein [Rhodothermaceae bacterium]
MTDVRKQIERNKAAYQAKKEEFEACYFGKIVLMHDGEFVNAYNDESDAYSIACDKFGLGNFSLHRVGQKPVDLGFAAFGIQL